MTRGGSCEAAQGRAAAGRVRVGGAPADRGVRVERPSAAAGRGLRAGGAGAAREREDGLGDGRRAAAEAAAGPAGGAERAAESRAQKVRERQAKES